MGLLASYDPRGNDSLRNYAMGDEQMTVKIELLAQALLNASAYIALCHKTVSCPTRNPEVDCNTDLSNPDICTECVAASYIAIAEAELEREKTQ